MIDKLISGVKDIRLDGGNDSQYNENPNRPPVSVWDPSENGDSIILHDGSSVNIRDEKCTIIPPSPNSVPTDNSYERASRSAPPRMEIKIISLVDPNTGTVAYRCPFEVESGESVGQVFRDINDTLFHGKLHTLNVYNSEYGHPALIARVQEGSPRLGKRFLAFDVTTGTASVDGHHDLGWNDEAEEEIEHLRGFANHWTQAQLISPMQLARRNQYTREIVPMYDLQDELLRLPRGDPNVSRLVAVGDVLVLALTNLFGVPAGISAHRRRIAVGVLENDGAAVGRRVDLDYDGIGYFTFRVEGARDCDIGRLACWCYCVVRILREMGFPFLDGNHNYVDVIVHLINRVTGEGV
jgi:hypothetical protein